MCRRENPTHINLIRRTSMREVLKDVLGRGIDLDERSLMHQQLVRRFPE
jgi:predicted nucleotidyltransferase